MFGILTRLRKYFVTVVPDDIAVCEFDCAKAECLHGDWIKCERRLQVQASQQRESESKTE